MPVDEAVLAIRIESEGARQADDAGADRRRDLGDQRGVFGQAGGAIGARHEIGRRFGQIHGDRDGDLDRRSLNGSVGAARQRR